jgi:hypothetical protein
MVVNYDISFLLEPKTNACTWEVWSASFLVAVLLSYVLCFPKCPLCPSGFLTGLSHSVCLPAVYMYDDSSSLLCRGHGFSFGFLSSQLLVE